MAFKILESNGQDITFRDGARLNNYIFSGKNGTIGSLNISLDSATNSLRIGKGILVIQGFRIIIDEEQEITFSGNSSKVNFTFELLGTLEVNSQDEVKFSIIKQVKGFPLTKDDIFSNGIYQIVLAEVNTTGDTINSFTKMLEELVPPDKDKDSDYVGNFWSNEFKHSGYTFDEDVRPLIVGNGSRTLGIAPTGIDDMQTYEFPNRSGKVALLDDIPALNSGTMVCGNLLIANDGDEYSFNSNTFNRCELTLFPTNHEYQGTLKIIAEDDYYEVNYMENQMANVKLIFDKSTGVLIIYVNGILEHYINYQGNDYSIIFQTKEMDNSAEICAYYWGM